MSTLSHALPLDDPGQCMQLPVPGFYMPDTLSRITSACVQSTIAHSHDG